MGYAALVNVPGFLPEDEFGTVFATPAEAWAWLEAEQHRSEAEAAGFTPFVASEVLTLLRAMAAFVQSRPNQPEWDDPAGITVVGLTSGGLGRLAFSVIPVDDEPDNPAATPHNIG